MRRLLVIVATGVLGIAAPSGLQSQAEAAAIPHAVAHGGHPAGVGGVPGGAHRAGVPKGLRAVIGKRLRSLSAAAPDTYTVPSPTPSAVINGVAGSNEQLGYSVSLSANGQTALVGVRDANNGDGGAYLYVESGGTWPSTPTATFTPPAGSGAFVGSAVALSADGGTALVGGGYGLPSGVANDVAYLYTAASGWSNVPAATYSYPLAGANPVAVALSGDGQTALVGVQYASGNLGAAYLYSASGGSWPTAPTATLVGTDPFFGTSVALSADGNTALVGDTGSASAGYAYLYTDSAGTWPATPDMTFTGINPTWSFGYSVALSSDGQTALIAAPYDNFGSGISGAAFVYTESATSGWSNTPTATFIPQTTYDPEFGVSVGLSSDGQVVLVGAPNAAESTGATYLYTGSSGWSNTPAVTFPGVAEGYASAVALSGDGETALVGAYAYGPGRAYVYTPPPPTSTAVSSSANPAAVGQAVTYTATVTGPSGTLPSTGETVAFDDGGSPVSGCGSAELSTTAPYTATCTATYDATAGSPHSVTAAYSGDSNYAPSTSAPLRETVHAATSATSITSTTATPVVGQPINVAVQVTGQYPGSGVAAPSGSVTVSDGTQSCEAALSGSNGVATGSCPLTEQAPRTYRLTAAYARDANYTASRATAVKVIVAKAATTTSLAISPTSVPYGGETAVGFTVTVSPQFSGTPAGQVTITSGTTALCTVTLSGGTGSCSPTSGTALPVGTHTVTAHYAGDAGFHTSRASQKLKVTAG